MTDDELEIIIQARQQRAQQRSRDFRQRLKQRMDTDPVFAEQYRAKCTAQKREQYHRNIEESRAKGRAWQALRRDRERAKSAKWRTANRDKFNECQRRSYTKYREDRIGRARKWKIHHPLYDKNRKYIKKYGITLDEFEQRFERQRGLCGVCGKAMSKDVRSNHALAPCIDHCHATERVRSIIHHRCNILLGMAADDPAILRSAAQYLEAHR